MYQVRAEDFKRIVVARRRAGAGDRYDVNPTVAVLSAAMKRNLFPWFKERGFDVDPTKSNIALQL